MLESQMPFRPTCLRNMRISNILLKLGAREGLTLAQIGKILCRTIDEDDKMSVLETVVARAEQQCSSLRLPALVKRRSVSDPTLASTTLEPEPLASECLLKAAYNDLGAESEEGGPWDT